MRAEELIAFVLRQKLERGSAGEPPRRVVMSMGSYRKLRDYHARLGEVPEGMEDYIGRYRLFDLPIYIDNATTCRVD